MQNHSIEHYVDGILAGSSVWLARGITLVESTLPAHRELADQLVVRLTGKSGAARRVGITGTPGVGKSTFIDTLGVMLTGRGHKVAVLAIDPSSQRTGGSILGDKTRMGRLAGDPNSFIRPSPTSGTLGGVTRATREAIVLLEAGGYDTVLVETVGVGQSETAVSDMVDTFLVLLLARSGDSLQGIKKGVLELADVLAINKADGDHIKQARMAARELKDALHLIGPQPSGWEPPVLTCSALKNINMETVWDAVTAHRDHLEARGVLAQKRRDQQHRWMWATVEDRLIRRVRDDANVQALLPRLEEGLTAATTTPTAAAEEILRAAGLDV